MPEISSAGSASLTKLTRRCTDMQLYTGCVPLLQLHDPITPVSKFARRLRTRSAKLVSSQRPGRTTSLQVSVVNLELINSSTYALCDFVSPASISFSNTARTSIGGFKPSRLARFQRFRRDMPMQGYHYGQHTSHLTVYSGTCARHLHHTAHSYPTPSIPSHTRSNLPDAPAALSA